MKPKNPLLKTTFQFKVQTSKLPKILARCQSNLIKEANKTIFDKDL
jgi:hypothetical protein